MATTVRAKLSEKNKYWISKHRYYELKHFCLQFPIWQKAYLALDEVCIPPNNLKIVTASTNIPGDPTAKCAIAKIYYTERIAMVKEVAMLTDPELYIYILRAVTEGLSFDYLKTRLEIPCSRDTYYDRYRKFFWLLSKERQ